MHLNFVTERKRRYGDNTLVVYMNRANLDSMNFSRYKLQYGYSKHVSLFLEVLIDFIINKK